VIKGKQHRDRKTFLVSGPLHQQKAPEHKVGGFHMGYVEKRLRLWGVLEGNVYEHIHFGAFGETMELVEKLLRERDREREAWGKNTVTGRLRNYRHKEREREPMPGET